MKVRPVKRPDGNEHELVIEIRHSCVNARAMRRALQDDEADSLAFGVGVVGHGLPLGTPFAVTSMNVCQVCGNQPSAWFEWTGPSVFLLS